MVGYLHAESAGVTFLQWKTDGAGALDGTIDGAAVSGSPPNSAVTTNAGSLTGQLDGRSVSLQVSFHTDYGSLSGDTLTLNVRQSDGSIRPIIYRRASPSDYNQALTTLRTAVAGANRRAGHDQQTAQEIKSLTDDYNTVGSDKGTLNGDLSTLASDVSTAGNDLKTAHDDEKKVLAESSSGTTDVCVDANGVDVDANGVSVDANGVSTDLVTVTNDLSALRKAVSSLQSSLQAVRTDVPTYNGGDGNPDLTEAKKAITDAQSFTTGLVTQVNSDIDQVNAHVADAYSYSAATSKAGQCGSASSAPTPIEHIK
ncbi:hypothetical protein ABT317_09325 [Streptomyces carpinensis]|uniref:Uncharacterized protein n=1 Tax=Streptomyces carpinensis TaxID=66369 RepID=A0ABV1VZ48_9ACTN